MGGGRRSKPNWVVFVGGPLDGERRIESLGANAVSFVVHTSGAADGIRIPHEYRYTGEVRPGGFHESSARIAVFVRSLQAEPTPPVAQHSGPPGPLG